MLGYTNRNLERIAKFFFWSRLFGFSSGIKEEDYIQDLISL
jgi:hypothetical protein